MIFLLWACHTAKNNETATESSQEDSMATVDSDDTSIDSRGNTVDCFEAFADTDGDSYGDPNVPRPSCDAEGNWVADTADCDDQQANIHPGAVEVCDGQDNDCNPETPETGMATWSAEDGSFSDFTGYLSAGTSDTPVRMALDNGSYALCSGTWFVQLDLEQSDIHLLGFGAEGSVVLDGGNSGSVLTVRGGQAVIADVVIQNGEGNYPLLNGAGLAGGGLACGEGAVVDVHGVTLQNNHAAIGGAFVVEDCALSASDLMIRDNSATYGGGLYAFGGNSVISDSIIQLNTAVISGGGIGLEGVNGPVYLDLNNTSLSENGATFGGGLVLYEEAYAICTGSLSNDGGFKRNTAESDGGGIYMTGGDFDPQLTTLDCDFGVDAQENDPSDIVTNAGAYAFGDDVSIQCANAGCN